MRLWLIIGVLGVVVTLQACSAGAEQTSHARYFDLKAYFTSEATRLQSTSPIIRKMVSIDSLTEERQLKIESWADELTAFTEADINKAAWAGMYTVDKQNNMERYSATADKTPVRLLVVKRRGNRVSGIEITIKTKNTLYTSTEELRYYPDSLYEINKAQAVRFKALKTYKVKGIFTSAPTRSLTQTPAAPLQ